MSNGTPPQHEAKLDPMRQRYVDSIVQWKVPGGKLLVDVRIKDVRYAYGLWSFEITPVLGMGARWVRHDSLAFLDLEDL